MGGIVSSVKLATLGRHERAVPVSDPAVATVADRVDHRSDSLPLAILNQRMPFRVNRFVPKPVQLNDVSSQAQQPDGAAAARVTGFVMGPRSMAIVEGIPGVSSSVAVRAGDRVGDWFVRSITTGGVMLERSGRIVRLALPELTRGNGQ